jgi:hypothetical protein
MQNRVANPLQLNNTYFAWNDTINDYCAHPWIHPELNWDLLHPEDVLWAFQRSMSSIMFAYGNFISTPEDIAKWGKHLFEADVFSQVTLEKMLTFIPMDVVESNPHRTGYGLGVIRYKICDRELWGHGGIQYGYVTQLVYYPEDSLSISVFLNDGIDYEKEFYARESITTELFAYILSFLHSYPKVEYKLKSNILVANPKWAPAIDTSLCIYNRGWGKDTIDISIDFRSIDSSAMSIEPSSFELAPGDSQIIKFIIDPSFFNNFYPIYLDLIIDSKFNDISPQIKVVLGIKTPIDKPEPNLPNKYVLYQNYPNPFNPITTIEFSLPKTELATLKVYNILGQEVSTLVSDKLNEGIYKYEWDASGYASGVYYYKLQAGEYVDCKKLVLLK